METDNWPKATESPLIVLFSHLNKYIYFTLYLQW